MVISVEWSIKKHSYNVGPPNVVGGLMNPVIIVVRGTFTNLAIQGAPHCTLAISHSYGKAPCSMEKSTISMAISYSYS